MNFKSIVCFLVLSTFVSCMEIQNGNMRDSKKFFGGYRITPRFCQPTRKNYENVKGPNICMFNHECLQRRGVVVGACMDGFLFGACCHLEKEQVGDFIESEIVALNPQDNNKINPLSPNVVQNTEKSNLVIMSSSHRPQPTNKPILATAEGNIMVHVNEEPPFGNSGIFNSTESIITMLNKQPNNQKTTSAYGSTFFNSFQANDFTFTTKPEFEDRKTTIKFEDVTSSPYSSDPPIVHITISNGPSTYSTLTKPMFKPKPAKPSNTDKYVLVPTISHEKKPPQEIESVVNILQLFNDTSSTSQPYFGSGTTIRLPITSLNDFGLLTTQEVKTTTRKPPSTSYVFSTNLPQRVTTPNVPSTSYVYSSTPPPRRTTTPKKQLTTKKKGNKPTQTKKPVKTSNKPNAPSFHSTFANSPSAYITTSKPPSTSYVYSPYPPTRRPATTVDTHIAGPGFSVTSEPGLYSSTSHIPSPSPTIVVLSPATDFDNAIPQYQATPTVYQQQTPQTRPTKRPANHVTINNHVTQNIYSSTSRPQYATTNQGNYGSFSSRPTVLITPKPTSNTNNNAPQEYPPSAGVEVEAETSANDLMNFPPVRNPNLNMSHYENDITTPAFEEDEALNSQMESFVNQIIAGLQEPFKGLKDVVYNRNTTDSSTKKPNKKQGNTTKKPVSTKRPSSNSARPATSSSRPGTKPTTNRISTRKPTTKKPVVTTTSTRKPTTSVKKTKRPPITTVSYIEEDITEGEPLVSKDDYKAQCGRRPLIKSGRIVGGKSSAFGAFPWQVLVRESTWLGLFTKNKCGGVLISNKYVMTAAHCQPGFLASLVAVFGEFDISGDLESRRPVSRNVKRVIVNRGYDAASFENDLALLELDEPVQFDQHIIPICLPSDNEDFTGRMATVTGWGRLKYGGGVPSVLQEVQVPIMENHVCQEMFRTAGHSKVILDSFLCAGYANGQKDSCEGDSGGPLVLQRPDGRYQLAGTVSHGIKCAAPYLPGVYMRTQYYKPWIESVTGLN